MADKFLLKLQRWSTPATAYPVKTIGKARLKHCYYNKNVYDMYHVRNPVELGGDGDRYLYFQCGQRMPVCALEIKSGKRWVVWMVDDPPHWYGMIEHASHYADHVLCAGLGLGLIVHALSANPRVERITVVEREQDVIDLIGPLLPQDKVKIVKADWYDYRHDGPVHGILHDLFKGNAFRLLDRAGAALAHASLLYPGAAVRVHGFSQRMIGDISSAYIAAGQSAEALARCAAG
jgi:hypothetical protein